MEWVCSVGLEFGTQVVASSKGQWENSFLGVLLGVPSTLAQGAFSLREEGMWGTRAGHYRGSRDPLGRGQCSEGASPDPRPQGGKNQNSS